MRELLVSRSLWILILIFEASSSKMAETLTEVEGISHFNYLSRHILEGF